MGIIMLQENLIEELIHESMYKETPWRKVFVELRQGINQVSEELYDCGELYNCGELYDCEELYECEKLYDCGELYDCE